MNGSDRREAIMALYEMFPSFRKAVIGTFNKKVFDLTRIQLIMMMTLYYKGSVSMGTLAKLVDTSNEQITRAAGKLTDKGYVTREQDKNNRRIVNISLSENAHSIIAEAEKEFLDNLQNRFDNVSDSDMIKLKESAEFISELLNRVADEE
ncbi:MAG: MarR family transcriptional regulator [Ruminococcus sp.]|nr:MarR family transcriptional regulator [Ruminococcus sp.]MBR1753081.1 MarR family transcriptional regulator [Ruminococcus sp.]